MTKMSTWLDADILLKQYKGNAIFIATMRAEMLLRQGDLEACAVWVDIAKAIDALQYQRPNKDEPVH